MEITFLAYVRALLKREVNQRQAELDAAQRRLDETAEIHAQAMHDVEAKRVALRIAQEAEQEAAR